MQVRKSVVDSVAVLTLVGDLDAHSADLSSADGLWLLPSHSDVLLDLSDVQHVTSAGLRTLLLVYRQCQRLGSSVAIVGLSLELRNVLAATGFAGYFRVAESVGDGIEVLAGNGSQERIRV
jgi:anti-sigma B factor antagonist